MTSARKLKLYLPSMVKEIALSISALRAAEVGGCFNPIDDPQGECADGDCYCSRECEREARASAEAIASWIEKRWGSLHPGVIAIRNELKI